jgi:hypothetical protein
VQPGEEVAPPWLAWCDALARALAVADAFAETLRLGDALPLGLPLGLAPALPLSVGLALVLALPLSVGLAVSLVWPPLDGLCGGGVGLGLVEGLVEAVDRVALAVADFAEPDACAWDGDKHGTTAGFVIPGVALPITEARPEVPGPGGLADVLGDPPAISLLTWTNVWRSGGTAASRTATMNTAMPMASAGRSIASRQSAGRRCAGRACPGAVPRRPGTAPRPRGPLCSPCAPDQRRTDPRTPARPARKPQRP